MRITVVLQDLYDTGANRVSLDRASRWQAAGDEVTVFVVTHETQPDLVAVPDGLRIQRGTRRPGQLRRVLPSALAALIRRGRRSDVLVAGTEVGFGLLLTWGAARLARRPFAVTVQSNVDTSIAEYVEPRLRRITRSALAHADLAVCVSQGLGPALLALGLPRERVVVATNAVDAEAVRSAAGLEPDPPLDTTLPVVVASGRLVRQKGFDLLIRAHALALERGAPQHRLVVLGEGEERAALLALARELGCAATVVLRGFTANPHATVARASLFVLSSRWEGFSLALVEALASGTPCLAFDCVAGPSEVLAGGAYGELVEPGDVPGLALALQAHLADPRPLAAKAALAARSPLEMFAPERASTRHRDAFDRFALHAGAPAGGGSSARR
jgi:glycosyltransferase involved in cell wall biosynthesis